VGGRKLRGGVSGNLRALNRKLFQGGSRHHENSVRRRTADKEIIIKWARETPEGKGFSIEGGRGKGFYRGTTFDHGRSSVRVLAVQKFFHAAREKGGAGRYRRELTVNHHRKSSSAAGESGKRTRVVRKKSMGRTSGKKSHRISCATRSSRAPVGGGGGTGRRPL